MKLLQTSSTKPENMLLSLCRENILVKTQNIDQHEWATCIEFALFNWTDVLKLINAFMNT